MFPCPDSVERSVGLWLTILLLSAGGSGARGANALEDDFGSAGLMIGATNVTASNLLATAQLLEPTHAGEPPNRSLWARWTAPFTGTYSISTSNSLTPRRLFLDTVLAVYTGDSLTNLTPVTSNDDAVPLNLWSRVFFRAHAGEIFHVAVDVIGTNTNSIGTINLRIEQPPRIMTPWTAFGINRVTISSQSYSNRILLVDFWETTCSACVEEFPELARLHHAFEPLGVSIIGLAVDPDVELVESFLVTHPVPYAIGQNNSSASNSLGGAVGMPVKYLVDQEDRVVARFSGGFSPMSEFFAFYSDALQLLMRPAPPVSLAIDRLGGQLRISWPLADPAFLLEEAGDPGATEWNLAGGEVETNNASAVVTIPVSPPARFFRLRKP